jgi:hypothetical protein
MWPECVSDMERVEPVRAIHCEQAPITNPFTIPPHSLPATPAVEEGSVHVPLTQGAHAVDDRRIRSRLAIH